MAVAKRNNPYREKFVVGWFDRNEWREVCRYLFSDNVKKQSHAISRIAVWKSRMLHNLPLPVECTCNIIQAVIEDRTAIETGSVTLKDLSLRMNYSTALVRFVTLLTEKLQKKSLAQPMHELAETLGVPFWMVELRHNAAHGMLPSLQMLRTGAQMALDYLKSEYWDVERMAGPEATWVVEREAMGVEDTLIRYMQDRYTELSTGKAVERKNRKISEELAISKLIRQVRRDKKTFLKCLLRDGYLIPESHQLKALGVDEKRYLDHEALWLPLALVDMWSELLPHLKLALSLMLEILINDAATVIPLRSKLMYSWAALILDSVSGGGNSSVDLFLPSSVPIDYRLLINVIVKSPNHWNRRLLPRLLLGVRPRLSKEKRSEILHWTDLRLGLCDGGRCRKRKRQIDLDDVRSMRQRMENVLQETKIDSDTAIAAASEGTVDTAAGHWKLADTSINWSECPFGQCPVNKVTYRNLELTPRDFSDSDGESAGVQRVRRRKSNIDDNSDVDSEREEATEHERDGCEWSQKDFERICSELKPL